MMTKSISYNSTRHVPQRTCVACRKTATKRELIRLVRNTDGSVEVDTDDKKPGRGAYLCPMLECWKTGLEGGQLERSLHTKLTRDNREQLVQFIGGISFTSVLQN